MTFGNLSAPARRQACLPTGRRGQVGKFINKDFSKILGFWVMALRILKEFFKLVTDGPYDD